MKTVCIQIGNSDDKLTQLFARLSAMGTKYNQDSIAVMVGETQFI